MKKGNDVVFGSMGFDIVYVTGVKGEYVVSALPWTTHPTSGEIYASVILLIDTVKSRDGYDPLYGVESIGFTSTDAQGTTIVNGTQLINELLLVSNSSNAMEIFGGVWNDFLAGSFIRLMSELLPVSNPVNAIEIFGRAGDDSVAGASGDDVLDGGNGTDIAIFLGVKSDYTVS